jgi:hypothetical protein
MAKGRSENTLFPYCLREGKGWGWVMTKLKEKKSITE